MKRKALLITAALLLVIRIPAGNQDAWSAGLAKLQSMMSILEARYYRDIDQEQLAFGSVRGMLETLDPHSYFLDPEDFSRMREDYTGKFFGLGIQIQKQDDRLVVVGVVESGPAWRLGVLTGDIIATIDGESTKPISSFEAMQKLRGEKGTPVTVSIVRDGLDKPFDLTVIREEIPLLSVPYAFLLEDGVAYAYVRNFAETTADELREHLARLSRQGMRSLILDLRFNGGGPLSQSVEVADLFLPKDVLVVTMRGRNREYNRDFPTSLDDQYETVPLIVLVNRSTASASEIVAGAIMDHDRGLVVGEDSWGKGLVQSVLPVAPNMAIALTTAKYYTPSGRSIQRDYSLLDNYYLAKVAPEADREVRYTDKGRKVLGQGGITPDYEVKETMKPLTGRLLLGGAFFTYARKLVRHQTGLTDRFVFPADLKAGGAAPASGRVVVDKTFVVDAAVLNDFRAYVRGLKIEFDEAAFAEAEPEIRHELEREIFGVLWGAEAGMKAYRRTDPAVRKALEVMPEAVRFVSGGKGG
ncbi:MAG: S41 family peptidase [Candidatus Aminicenantes bacterium]|nr:S41 family peptidase [Candidatus Aminicenantes bacterium]